MGFNFFELMNKWNQFQQMLQHSGKNPQQLLEEELKKRNISSEQLNQMIEQAKQFEKLLNVK